jgi:8-oxo-dGTP pyrophosphatase MutT (NUDIX family)
MMSNEVNYSQAYFSDLINKLDGKLDHNYCDVPPDRNDGYFPAAVMILFVRENDQWNILFTQRTHSVRDHKGQVSFPGGAWEDQDLCLKETALRETFEEIGIKKEEIQILGSMPPVKTISNYVITPFVGLISPELKFHLEPAEVESVFSIPFAWLADESNREEREFIDSNSNIHRNVIFYKEYGGHLLWGITAMLTIKILELIK